MNDLNQLILKWADDKGILANGTPEGQLAKTLEELIETAQAVALYDNQSRYDTSERDFLEEVKDGIGDVYVTLVIHAKLAGYEFSSHERANLANDMTNKYIFNEFSIWLPALARNESPEMLSRTMIFLTHGLAMNHGLALRECVEHSYNVIAKRTGKMQDGVFVKDN
jgi:hypothetical protein